MLLTTSIASAQDVVVQNDFEHKINLYNVNGRPIVNSPIEAAGNPYFIDQWKFGKIKLADNQVFDHVAMKVDLEHQQIHYRSQDKKEFVIDAGVVRQVQFADSLASPTVNESFQCGFPSIDNQNEHNFYRVLTDGKITFLESMRKILHEEKDEFSGDTRKEFKLYEDYYFFQNGHMDRIRREKNYILHFMSDKDRQINEFIATNKFSFKSTEDIKRLVTYYNSLP